MAMISPLAVRPIAVRDAEAVVVGSGVAGLSAALALAPRPVTVLTARRNGGSTPMARGGIAAAIGPDDTPARHAADTVRVGGGLSDAGLARTLAAEGAARVTDLIADGMAFDGGVPPALGREAGHSRHRIVHAGGDATGEALIAHLWAQVAAAPTITIATGATAWDLWLEGGRLAGVVAWHDGDGWVAHRSRRVILATGGAAYAYRHTTNRPETNGAGLAMATRLGAAVVDPEFMQFHPTALAATDAADAAADCLPLLTEALRGEGARLVDGSGSRIMADIHPDGDLAPRDVVARAIARHRNGGNPVFLDMTHLGDRLAARFPRALAACRSAGFDPSHRPVPVAPAAHYHMGGIATDARGRTTVPGLWACGEAAGSGVHGANRLASNSLLEGLVFGARAGYDAGDTEAGRSAAAAPAAVSTPSLPETEIRDLITAVRDTMDRHVGVARDAQGLATALSVLETIGDRLVPWQVRPGPWRLPGTSARSLAALRSLVDAGRLIASAALDRRESRGAHWRSDFPDTDPAQAGHTVTRPDDPATGLATAAQ